MVGGTEVGRGRDGERVPNPLPGFRFRMGSGGALNKSSEAETLEGQLI